MNKSDYSDEEAREILKRAVVHQETDEFKYNEQQLFDLGRDIGLAPDAIVKAEQELLRNKATSQPAAPTPEISAEEALFRRERLQPFKVHVAVFIAAIPLLLFLNFVTSGLAFPWALIAILGWVMGLVGYYMTDGRMEGEGYEKAYDKWRRKRQRRLAQAKNDQ